MKNIFASLLGDAKGRMLLIFAAVISVGVVFVMLGRGGQRASVDDIKSTASRIPQTIDSIPGQNPSEEYNRLQAEANQRAAEQAIKEGGSAVGSILYSEARVEKLDQQKKEEAINPDKAYQEALLQQRLLDAQLEAERLRQQQQGSPAQSEDFGDEVAMANQAKSLLGAWVPPQQVFVAGAFEKEAQNQAALQARGVAAGQAAPPNQQQPQPTALVKAGHSLLAMLDTEVNTDDGSTAPVSATVMMGPYKGAKLVGSVVRQKDKAIIRFTTLNIPGVPNSIAVNAVAVDPDTARAALATDVDHHYFLRYGTLFASSFLEGLGKAIIPNQQYIIPFVSDANVNESIPRKLDGREQALVAIGKVGENWGKNINQFNTPPTVTVASGTGIGILFLTDAIASEKAGKNGFLSPQAAKAQQLAENQAAGAPKAASPNGQEAGLTDNDLKFLRANVFNPNKAYE